MCADGSHVRCCGDNCCPRPSSGGGGGSSSGGWEGMFFNSLQQGIQAGQAAYQRQFQMQRRLAAERLRRERAEAERRRKEEEERMRREAERRRREREGILKTMKGAALADGPLPMKDETAGGEADPWCFENPPKSDCDEAWERRCGNPDRPCRLVDKSEPRSEFDTASGRIYHIEGPVFIQRAKGRKWARLKDGARIHPGDALKTGRSGRLEVVLTDGPADTYLTLGPDSEFVFKEVERESITRRLARGFARLKVHCAKGLQDCLARTAAESRYRYSFGVAVVAVRGTEFDLAVADNGASSLVLHEGRVDLEAETVSEPREPWIARARADKNRNLDLGGGLRILLGPETQVDTSKGCRLLEGTALIEYSGGGAGRALCGVPGGSAATLSPEVRLQLSVGKDGVPLVRIHAGRVELAAGPD